MPNWPNRIPADLAHALAELDRRRDPPGDQDRWGEIRDWLIKHGVEAPEELPMDPELPRAIGKYD